MVCNLAFLVISFLNVPSCSSFCELASSHLVCNLFDLVYKEDTTVLISDERVGWFWIQCIKEYSSKQECFGSCCGFVIFILLFVIRSYWFWYYRNAFVM